MTKPKRGHVRVQFPDGRNVDVRLADLQRSQDAQDRAIEALPNEFSPQAIAEARERIERRLALATDAEFNRLARVAAAKKSTRKRVDAAAWTRNERLVIDAYDRFKEKHRREPKAADLVAACQAGGWTAATASNVSRTLRRLAIAK